MRRQEYIELVNDWNIFLLKEEKRLLNEQLLIESILLNENKLKRLARKYGVSSLVAKIALMSMFSGISVSEAAPDATPNNLAQAEKLVNTFDSDGIRVDGDETFSSVFNKDKFEITQEQLRKLEEKIKEICSKDFKSLTDNDANATFRAISFVYSYSFGTHNIKAGIKSAKKIISATKKLFSTQIDEKKAQEKIEAFVDEDNLQDLNKVARPAAILLTCTYLRENCSKFLEEMSSGEQQTTFGYIDSQSAVKTADGKKSVVNSGKKYYERFSGEAAERYTKSLEAVKKVLLYQVGLIKEKPGDTLIEIVNKIVDILVNESGQLEEKSLEELGLGYLTVGEIVYMGEDNVRIQGLTASYAQAGAASDLDGIKGTISAQDAVDSPYSANQRLNQFLSDKD